MRLPVACAREQDSVRIEPASKDIPQKQSVGTAAWVIVEKADVPTGRVTDALPSHAEVHFAVCLIRLHRLPSDPPMRLTPAAAMMMCSGHIVPLLYDEADSRS